jgi:hypothetical protein
MEGRKGSGGWKDGGRMVGWKGGWRGSMEGREG